LALILEEVTATQLRYRELSSTVEQRLKWAAGANPEVQNVFDRYTTSFVKEMESLKVFSIHVFYIK